MQLENALLSSDGRFVYPVVDDILILLPSLAIARMEGAQGSSYQHLASDTDSVMRFYDEVGWQSKKDVVFQDAELFEDLRPVSKEYIHRCHLRINEHLLPGGKYLLDAASGPVQYREYLTYSETYERRICVDVSLTALRAAKEKLGDKGIYMQCDITQLPLKTASVDGFVSLHTIYHVPEKKQASAFKELERVLRPGRTGAVVYTWGDHSLAMQLTLHPVQASKQLIKRVLPAAAIKRLKNGSGAKPLSSAEREEPKLYFHPHDYHWFHREIASTSDWDVRSWRSVSVPFLKAYMHSKLLGRRLLSALFWMENAAPHLCGKFGCYPLLVYTKPGSGGVRNRHS
jgi:ubiquinone/menaquinone biosynthesis C-methylase UbiE